MEEKDVHKMFNEFLESELGIKLRAKKDKLGGRIRAYKTDMKRGKIKPRSLISLLFECGAIDIKLKGKARKKE